MLIIIIAITVAPAGAARIGLYALDGGYTCNHGIEPYVPLDVYIVASWQWGHNVPGGLTGARFKITNLPENDGYPVGWINEFWNSDIHTGDLNKELFIEFEEAQGSESEMVVLGRLEFFQIDPMWIGSDYQMSTFGGDDCFCLRIYDAQGEPVDVYTSDFIFNCSLDDCWFDDCYPPDPPVQVFEESWTTIKAMY
jgi:hypothetical protein